MGLPAAHPSSRCEIKNILPRGRGIAFQAVPVRVWLHIISSLQYRARYFIKKKPALMSPLFASKISLEGWAAWLDLFR